MNENTIIPDLIRRRDLKRGDVVECPVRSSVGPHDATVTHVDPVGDSRSVVSLSCRHDVNMSDWHGLYRVGVLA